LLLSTSAASGCGAGDGGVCVLTDAATYQDQDVGVALRLEQCAQKVVSAKTMAPVARALACAPLSG